MKEVLVRTGLALSIVLASSAAWATVPDLAAKLQGSITSGDVVQQRKDVDEGSRPPPPSGPASQTTVCSPSAPDCP